MLGRVTGRGQHPKHQAAEVELVTGVKGAMGPRQIALVRGQDVDSQGAQLPIPGDEVGVEVSLSGQGQLDLPTFGLSQVGPGVAAGVDNHRSPITQIDEPGSVAESLVHERYDVHSSSPELSVASSVGRSIEPVPSAPRATGNPARRHSGKPSWSRRARTPRRRSARTASSAKTQ